MEETFNKLKEAKQNCVKNLVKWMKDSKVIDDSKSSEEKASKMLADVKDVTDVELDKFKQTVSKLAEEQAKTMDEFTKKLSEEGPKLLTAVQAGLGSAVQAGVSSFKDAMAKK